MELIAATKLLLADDSVTIQRVIELTFADEDVKVVAVGDGKQAIERVQSDRPDIVLADVGMPERDGYEVAAFIKGDPPLAHIPVLLLTGAFEPIDEARARAVGCDGVLVKPFEPQMVISRVQAICSPASATESSGNACGTVPRRAAPEPRRRARGIFRSSSMRHCAQHESAAGAAVCRRRRSLTPLERGARTRRMDLVRLEPAGLPPATKRLLAQPMAAISAAPSQRAAADAVAVFCRQSRRGFQRAACRRAGPRGRAGDSCRARRRATSAAPPDARCPTAVIDAIAARVIARMGDDKMRDRRTRRRRAPRPRRNRSHQECPVVDAVARFSFRCHQ